MKRIFFLSLCALAAVWLLVYVSPSPRYIHPDCGPTHHKSPLSDIGPRSEWDRDL